MSERSLAAPKLHETRKRKLYKLFLRECLSNPNSAKATLHLDKDKQVLRLVNASAHKLNFVFQQVLDSSPDNTEQVAQLRVEPKTGHISPRAHVYIAIHRVQSETNDQVSAPLVSAIDKVIARLNLFYWRRDDPPSTNASSEEANRLFGGLVRIDCYTDKSNSSMSQHNAIWWLTRLFRPTIILVVIIYNLALIKHLTLR